MILAITGCCLAIEINARESWQPQLAWLMLAPGCGLVFGAMPGLLQARRNRRIRRDLTERDELVGLFLRDYAAERSDWLWSSDREGRLRGVTEKLAGHAGKKVRDLEGAAWLDFLAGHAPAGSLALFAIETAMRQHKSFFDIELALRPGGQDRWWRLAGKAVFRDQRFAGYVGTASDITAEVVARDGTSVVTIGSGTVIEAEVIVSAVGDTPNVEWLATSGLLTGGALVVDRRGLVRPNIAAAGDVAAFPHAGRVARIPLWTSAIDQAKVAAAALLKPDAPELAFQQYFWTEAFGISLKAIGWTPVAGEAEIVEGTAGQGVLRWHHSDGSATAVALDYRIPIPKLRRLAARSV